MDPDLGALAFDAEETRLGVMANGAEVLAVTWRRCGQGLGAIDLDAKLLPYSSWRFK